MVRNATMAFVNKGDGTLEFRRGRKAEKGEKWTRKFVAGKQTFERGQAVKLDTIELLTNGGVRVEIEPRQPKRVVTFEDAGKALAVKAIHEPKEEAPATPPAKA